MNAVEFVRNQINEFGLDAGWEKTKAHLDYLISYGSEFGHVSKQEVEDLKRLVDSWELVESYGGVGNAKVELLKIKRHPMRGDYVMVSKAIRDVESVGGGV